MAKDTRIAFRASAELKARLAKASKKLKLGETTLAEAAVEAAVEYIEEHGGIWFPLRVVPDPEAAAPPPGKNPAWGGQRTTGPTDAEAAPIGSRSTGSRPTNLNEDSPKDAPVPLPARKAKASGPRARSTRGGIQRVIEHDKKS